ncbi:MAG: carbohydrate ABC transporter permease [Actinomycetota bacterium]|nr:carbohydrate ABC transporter permease [Actinomycetota bacterium]
MSWLILAALVVLLVLLVSPFVIVVMNAFKTPSEYASGGPLEFPSGFYLDGIRALWDRIDFSQKLWNSLLISTSVAVLGVVLSVLNAYALGIGRVRGRTWLLVLFLIANTLPQEALVYPIYYASNEIGLYNSRILIIIIFTVIQSAFGTYLLSSTLSAFPREIIEAAEMDGATRFQVLWRVIIPISRPTLMVLFTFFFIWTWNEFFLPLIFLVTNDTQTVPVALGVLQGQRLVDATAQSASALLGIVPALIFFAIFQRTLAKGVTAGALK